MIEKGFGADSKATVQQIHIDTGAEVLSELSKVVSSPELKQTISKVQANMHLPPSGSADGGFTPLSVAIVSVSTVTTYSPNGNSVNL